MTNASLPAVEKAELHVHLEGTISPDMAKTLAAKNGAALPADLFKADGTYNWSGFVDFLNAYDKAAGCLKTAEDYKAITYDYLKRSAAEGVIYAELIASPDHGDLIGLAWPDMIKGVAEGIDEARRDFGIEARVIATIVRHYGIAQAEGVIERVLNHPHPYVVGFGIAGDENARPAAEFKTMFDRARAAGLKVSAHAGEANGPQSIRDALTVFGADRIGHGVRSVEDPALVAELARRGTVLEVCPSSNVEIGIYKDHASHPLRRLFDAGVKVTLGSDDPPFFFTSIGREYQIARDAYGFTLPELKTLTRNAIQGSFAEPALKAKLLAKLNPSGPKP